MLTEFRLSFAAAVGVGLGLYSAWWALADPRFDVTSRVGHWQVIGGKVPDDPYAYARMAIRGSVGLAAAEGVMFVTDQDDGGTVLSPTCQYRIEGAVPADALWTVAVTDRAGRPPGNLAHRAGYSAYDALRFPPDNRIDIGVGPVLRPGDFVISDGLDDLRVTYRIYGATAGNRPLTAADLPAITRVDCSGPAS